MLRRTKAWGVGLLTSALMVGPIAGCDDSSETDPATGGSSVGASGGTGGSGASAGSGAGGTGGNGGNGGTGAGATGGGGGSPSCELLFSEDFDDDDLEGRGWAGGLNGSGYSVVADAELGHNAFEFGFQTGDSSPGSTVNHLFPANEEITVEYKLRVGPDWEWTVPHHMVMMHSNRDVSEGNGSPANAFGATYFEWEWNTPGVFIGKFQDNRACNCNYGYQDLTALTEERSVGGYQTWSAPDGQHVSSWGDPCQDGIDSYTGQSVLTVYAEAGNHPMTQNEWWTVQIHLRMNTIQGGIGQWDGAFRVQWQGPNDASPVLVMDSQDVLWRAGGSNGNLMWEKFMMAPYLHDGATQAMWVRIADVRIYEGACF